MSAGVLNVQNATALGTTGSGTTVSSGATLQLEGGITIGAEALSIVGSGASGQTGALVNTGGVNNYGGLITLTGGTTVGSDSGTLNLTNTGTITGSGSGLTLAGAANGSISSIIGTGTGSLTKNGSGTWSLLGANTLTGNVTISAGTLTLAATSGSALGATNAITVNSGGTLLLGANNQINNAASITLAGGTFAKGNFNEGGAAAPGVGALTLAATGSILDFGTGTVGVLEFASFTANGLLLAINNWTGLANTVGSGSTDRLIFGSDQSANLGGFSFSGYSGATQFALGGGYFEIVPTSPVPEPATYFGGLLTLLALAYTQRHRLKRQKLTLSLRKTDTAP
ncbi:MAG: autotransporter-associated beta strand repeat-containing protein [Chthoniobacterales bacterium]